MSQDSMNMLFGYTAIYLPAVIMGIWLMVYVLRRGYSVGWFFVILVLGSVGFFILPVYLLIWALHRSFIKKDTVTRQCPNCGGFKSSPGFSKRRHEADPVVYAYSCYLCGNKWAWQ